MSRRKGFSEQMMRINEELKKELIQKRLLIILNKVGLPHTIESIKPVVEVPTGEAKYYIFKVSLLDCKESIIFKMPVLPIYNDQTVIHINDFPIAIGAMKIIDEILKLIITTIGGAISEKQK